jgi:hypothetical protein
MRDAVSAPVIRIWCVILRRLLDNYDVSQLKKNPYKTDKSFQGIRSARPGDTEGRPAFGVSNAPVGQYIDDTNGEPLLRGLGSPDLELASMRARVKGSMCLLLGSDHATAPRRGTMILITRI